MNLDLTDEQRLMADTAARFFADAGTLEEARRVGDGYAAPLWRETWKIGFVTMRVPADAGGLDAGLMDAVLVCEAAGRAATPIPLADGIAAARLLAMLGGDAARARLTTLADAPLAFADRHVDRLTLVGNAVTLSPREGAAIPLAGGADAVAAFQAAQVERTLLRAAWLVGAATRAIELAAAYATERKQFGRPIGSFQGVALPLADSITDIEAGRLLVWRAVWAIASAQGDAAATVSMADWWLATASRIAVRRSLRTFGGYGLSTEYDIHLYFLAINRIALADGDPDARIALAGDRLWSGAATALPHVGEPGVDLGLGAKAEAYAEQVRAFFDRAMTPALRAKAHHGTDGHDPAFHKQLAAAGFAYPDWPARWGGEDRDAMEITALGRVFEENRWTRVPIGCTNMGARMVMQFGSPDLQAEVLPELAAGDALACLGFTEPESGSDMYGARTRAVRDGNDWIVTGQKMFTTGAHLSRYVLMIARTDAEKAKHRGLTIFFVPMDLPGVSIQPVHTLQDERTNITFYDEVRIPDRYRLGEVDGGLEVMAAAMKIEHGGEGYHIHHRSLMEAALNWAFAADESNGRPIDDRAVRIRLAKVATHLSLADLLCRRATQAGEAGTTTRAGGPMAKLFATEIYMADAADLLALTAPASLAHKTPAVAEIEEFHRQAIGQTIYGGTSEVHRTIIAQHALGLPRST